MKSTRIEYAEASLDIVLRYFAKDFELRKGDVICGVEATCDPAKNRVVYRLAIQSEVLS